MLANDQKLDQARKKVRTFLIRNVPSSPPPPLIYESESKNCSFGSLSLSRSDLIIAISQPACVLAPSNVFPKHISSTLFLSLFTCQNGVFQV